MQSTKRIFAYLANSQRDGRYSGRAAARPGVRVDARQSSNASGSWPRNYGLYTKVPHGESAGDMFGAARLDSAARRFYLARASSAAGFESGQARFMARRSATVKVVPLEATWCRFYGRPGSGRAAVRIENRLQGLGGGHRTSSGRRFLGVLGWPREGGGNAPRRAQKARIFGREL